MFISPCVSEYLSDLLHVVLYILKIFNNKRSKRVKYIKRTKRIKLRFSTILRYHSSYFFSRSFCLNSIKIKIQPIRNSSHESSNRTLNVKIAWSLVYPNNLQNSINKNFDYAASNIYISKSIISQNFSRSNIWVNLYIQLSQSVLIFIYTYLCFSFQ